MFTRSKINLMMLMVEVLKTLMMTLIMMIEIFMMLSLQKSQNKKGDEKQKVNDSLFYLFPPPFSPSSRSI